MFAYFQEMPGATREMSARVDAEIGPDVPPGLIGHVAGPSSNGWRIIDIWETEEDYERFAAERLGPAVQRATSGHAPLPMPVTQLKVTGDPELSRRPQQAHAL